MRVGEPVADPVGQVRRSGGDEAVRPAADVVPRATPVIHALPPATLFHESWWLDISTDGRWSSVNVIHGNRVIGELPFWMTRRGPWRIAHLPPLTRMLGPAIVRSGSDPQRDRHHDFNIMTRLVEQLPPTDSFFQILDPSVDDAIAFALHGFTVTARYTFRIAPGQDVERSWSQMKSKTRNVIRGAEKCLTVASIDTTRTFVQFYEANLVSRARRNAYGSAVMTRLVQACLERGAGRLLGAWNADGRLVAAIGLVWDARTMYYLLSSRASDAHAGAISLLIWTGMREAITRGITFDFDGISCLSTFNFLNGFGGTLTQRLGVERLGTTYALAREFRRRLSFSRDEPFSPYL